MMRVEAMMKMAFFRASYAPTIFSLSCEHACVCVCVCGGGGGGGGGGLQSIPDGGRQPGTMVKSTHMVMEL